MFLLTNSLMVMGWQRPEKGWSDQAELARSVLTACVGLNKSHQTWVEASSQAASMEIHPIIAFFKPSPQHALLVSSKPVHS